MGYYVIKRSKSTVKTEFYFVLKASNGEVIATSEMYTSKQAAHNGIKSVQQNGPTSDIRDES
ncbi:MULTISPECIES: YegP family protein [Winslowiella]|uniref:YegP family protein n=1 Tax=Winslowiella TaxID=2997349 RepID=UPI0028BE5F24|nr:YegP family protein [Winslowiella toletana]WNN42558.1 YegP family protein [Winslowiella toletana]